MDYVFHEAADALVEDWSRNPSRAEAVDLLFTALDAMRGDLRAYPTRVFRMESQGGHDVPVQVGDRYDLSVVDGFPRVSRVGRAGGRFLRIAWTVGVEEDDPNQHRIEVLSFGLSDD